MRLKNRVLADTIRKAVKTFPAIVLTGPRQSGKTTLLKMLFSETHTLVSLENPDIRIRAKDDPVNFLKRYAPPVVIDEIQYVPELLPYIKTKIDEDRKPGQWLLTGSQNFVLMHNVTQSLAGRAAILSLLPFSLAECVDNAGDAKGVSAWRKEVEINEKINKRISLSDILLRGFYPEIASNKKVDRQLWCSSYITTYLERDVRNLSNIGDLGQFERFLVACAARTGQILNISEIARTIGISVPTAKRWLSLLETGYQIYLLYPYYRNIGKRLVKSPKIYFNDPALCSYLLGLNDPEALTAGPSFGNLFETMIVCDFLKRFLNFGEKPAMYYLRSRDGLEIDLVIEREGKIHLFEIKSSMTITTKHAVSLKRVIDELGTKIETAAIISGADENFPIKEKILNISWKNLLIS
ncbi:MAG: ATP-binding protein [Candidatus Omnitrophota bacterium]|nr:ATP-binding protein [Candidatus Omnitrophota bacterium]